MASTNPERAEETTKLYTLSEMMALIYDPKDVDCTFHIRPADGDDIQQICAHRKLLALFSSRFARMFANKTIKLEPIVIEHVSFESFQDFLKSFYEGEINLTPRNVDEILFLAAEYDVKKVLNNAAQFVQNHLTINNVIDSHDIAVRYKINSLKEECSKFFIIHASCVLKSATFLRCHCEMLQHLLKNHPTLCDAAFLIDRCIERAEHHCRTENIECSTTNIRAKLNDCFEYLPYDRLNREQFIDRYEKWQQLFTPAEIAPILWKQLKAATPRMILKYRGPDINFEFARFNQQSTITNCLRFKLSKSVALKAITISPGIVNGAKVAVLVDITIKKGRKQFHKIQHEFPSDSPMYTFPQPILMESDEVYEIRAYRHVQSIHVYMHLFKRQQIDGLDLMPINYGDKGEYSESLRTSISALSFIHIAGEEMLSVGQTLR